MTGFSVSLGGFDSLLLRSARLFVTYAIIELSFRIGIPICVGFLIVGRVGGGVRSSSKVRQPREKAPITEGFASKTKGRMAKPLLGFAHFDFLLRHHERCGRDAETAYCTVLIDSIRL